MSDQKCNLLFVCIENSNRSQMAEAFARLHGGDAVNAWSAGSRPCGSVNPRAVAAMQERNVDLTVHSSKGLDDVPAVEWDWIVTMGCGDACPSIPARNRDDWALPDPREMDPEDFNKVRDEIEGRVVSLLRQMNVEVKNYE